MNRPICRDYHARSLIRLSLGLGQGEEQRRKNAMIAITQQSITESARQPLRPKYSHRR
jgi:hypothetical protein